MTTERILPMKYYIDLTYTLGGIQPVASCGGGDTLRLMVPFIWLQVFPLVEEDRREFFWPPKRLCQGLWDLHREKKGNKIG